jgi:recombination protein RecT
MTTDTGKELVIAKQVAGALKKMAPEYRAVLPAHITPEAFIRVAQTAIQMNEDLQLCTPKSLISSCTRIAEMGLQPNGEEAAIVAYNVKVSKKGELDRFEKQAKATPMIAGLRDLVRRSGQVKDWKFRAVYSQDHFEHIDGDVERLTHIPAHAPGDRLVKVYAIAYLENGELSRCVMTIEEVEAIRRRSRAPDYGPWKSDYVQMALKTVGRRHYKALPRSKDHMTRRHLMSAVRALDDAEGVLEDRHPAQALIESPMSMQEAARQRLAAAADNVVFDAETGEVMDDRSQAAAPRQKGRRKTANEKLAEAEGRPAPQAAQQPSRAGTNDDELFPGDPEPDYSRDDDPGERDGEDPRELAYRDGWHARAAGKTRMPPLTLRGTDAIAAWLKGWDNYQAAVDIGNAPRDADASEAMLDQMVGRVFV